MSLYNLFSAMADIIAILFKEIAKYKRRKRD